MSGKHPSSALADGDLGSYDTAQAAAIAGLRSIKEHHLEVGGGVLFNPTTGKYAYTQPVGEDDGYHFGASVQVPPGWHLQAIYHTHPPGQGSTKFSGDDVDIANQLKVPSYILPHYDGKIRMYDPNASKVTSNGSPTFGYAGNEVDETPPQSPAAQNSSADPYKAVGTPTADPYAAIASSAAAPSATPTNP